MFKRGRLVKKPDNFFVLESKHGFGGRAAGRIPNMRRADLPAFGSGDRIIMDEAYSFSYIGDMGFRIRWFLIGMFAIHSGNIHAAKADPATKGDIELLIHQIDKRFEQVDKRFEQIDKRFEQIDKRFEQVDKRFDHLLWFIGVLTTLSTLAIGYVVTRLHRQEAHEYARELNIPALAIAIKNADPAIKKLFKEALR